MKKIKKIITFNMINNFVIAMIKVFFGSLFNLSSLVADGISTFCDFITDIISLVGINFSKKKANKLHPFGFGKMEYLSNIFVGFILILLIIFILIYSFNTKHTIPSLNIIYVLIICLILKFVFLIILKKSSVKYHSQILKIGVTESLMDIYATIAVFVTSILLQFSDKYEVLKHCDKVTSIIICILLFNSALKIIINNSLAIIGEKEDNKELNNKLNVLLNKYSSIKEYKVYLIKYGFYYRLQLFIELDSSSTLKKITNLEDRIKKDIKNNKELNIKFVAIYVTNKLNHTNF